MKLYEFKLAAAAVIDNVMEGHFDNVEWKNWERKALIEELALVMLDAAEEREKHTMKTFFEYAQYLIDDRI